MLSNKKYIETQARKLPIYKCLVNVDWENSKMANVFVMRKHVNGMVTIGIYLVDLLCLGVKDTFYVFNEPEKLLMDRYEQLNTETKEINYNLAHNIIFAGHDFAMEFDIQPHKDFALTKMILEDDNDDIPIIEIAVGWRDGKPHLMVEKPSDYVNALAKLKKNAGEGNYYYTIGENLSLEDDDANWEDEEDDDLEDDDSEEMEDETLDYMDEQSINLDNYDFGEINPYTVQYIVNEDLQNSDKVLLREQFEILIIQVELLLRLLMQSHPVYFFTTEVMDRDEYELIENANVHPEYFSIEEYSESSNVLFGSAIEQNDLNIDEEESEERFLKQLDEYSNNKMFTVFSYEIAVLGSYKELLRRVQQKLEMHKADYPIYAIYLTLVEMVTDSGRKKSAHLDLSSELGYLFPQVDSWSLHELKAWWLAQVVYYVRQNDVKLAIHFYQLLAEIELPNFMESLVQQELSDALTKLFLSDDDNSKKSYLRIV